MRMDDLTALAAMMDACVGRATRLETRLATTLRVAERALKYNDRINHLRQTHAAVKSSLTPRTETEVDNACTTHR